MLGRYQIDELLEDVEPADLPAVFKAASEAGMPKQGEADPTGCDGIRALASVIAGRIGPREPGPEKAAAE
jgi:hypothetical protein